MMVDPGAPDRRHRLGQSVAALALGLAAAVLAVAALRASGGAGWSSVALPLLAFGASGLATTAGLAPGLLLLPLCLVAQQLGFLRVAPAALAPTVLIAAAAALVGALAMRGLAGWAVGKPMADRARLAFVVAATATAAPTAAMTAVTFDWPDKALLALFAIVGLLVATLVGALAFVAGAQEPGDAGAAPRFERFDWRMSLLLGLVGGYALGHVPFGLSEVLLVYLVLRGFPAGFSAGAALAAALVPVLAVLPPALIRHSIDFPLAFAIVPAAFSGSVVAGWWLRGASPLVGANVLALLAVATNLGIIILALR